MDFRLREPAPVETLGESALLSTWHFTVKRLHLRWGTEECVRDIEVHRGSAAVVALDELSKVTLIRQFRVPLDRWTLEIPTGGCEEGESPIETAARELTEEVGLVAVTLQPLVTFANAPGHSTQWTHVFLADSCSRAERAPQGVEERSSNVVSLPLSRAVDLVHSGVIVDAKSMLGLLAAKRKVQGK